MLASSSLHGLLLSLSTLYPRPPPILFFSLHSVPPLFHFCVLYWTQTKEQKLYRKAGNEASTLIGDIHFNFICGRCPHDWMMLVLQTWLWWSLMTLAFEAQLWGRLPHKWRTTITYYTPNGKTHIHGQNHQSACICPYSLPVWQGLLECVVKGSRTAWSQPILVLAGTVRDIEQLKDSQISWNKF